MIACGLQQQFEVMGASLGMQGARAIKRHRNMGGGGARLHGRRKDEGRRRFTY